MPLINAEMAINLIRNFRSVHIAGRFGGGKTSISSMLAYEFVKRGYVQNVVANFPLSIATFPPPIPLVHSVIIMDEAHQYVKAGKDVTTYMQNLRKWNLIYLMPAVYSPHHEFRRLSIKRLFNCYKFGLPVWIYQFILRDGAKAEKGIFYWLHPLRELPGLYSTEYSPTSDWGISYAIAQNNAIIRAEAEGAALDENLQLEHGRRRDDSGTIADVSMIEATEIMADIAAMKK